MPESMGLLFQSCHDSGMTVAECRCRDPAHQVEILTAVCIEQQAAFTAFDRDGLRFVVAYERAVGPLGPLCVLVHRYLRACQVLDRRICTLRDGFNLMIGGLLGGLLGSPCEAD